MAVTGFSGAALQRYSTVLSHHIKGTHYCDLHKRIHDYFDLSLLVLTLITHWDFVIFHHLVFLPSILYFLEKTYATHASRELYSSSMRTQYWHKLFEILSCGRFVSSSPMYWLSQLLIYILMYSLYLFYSLGYNPMVFIYCVAHMAPALAIGSSLSQSICLNTIIVGFLCFWALSYFLSLQDSSGPSCVFPTLFLRLAFLFDWRMVLEMAAKSLQSCQTLCDPIDGSPTGSPIPGILQARTLEWVAISFSNAWKWKVKGKSLSHIWLLATPWTAAYQAPPSMGFSRQEYWSGVPLPSPLETKIYIILSEVSQTVISYDITYMWNLKMIQMKLFTNQE